MPSHGLILSLPVNIVPKKIAPNAPNNILANPAVYFFASFSIVSVTPFVNTPDSSSDLTIFKISFVSSFEITIVVVRGAKSEGQPDPKKNVYE